MYESVAKIDKFTIGDAVFFDQAIKISGGINPSNVSDIKNTIRIPILENFWVRNSKPSLIVNTYSLTRYSPNIIRIAGISAFFKVSPIKV